MTGLTNDEEALAMEQIVRIDMQIKELEEQKDRLKQFFKDHADQYPVGTKITRGQFVLKVTSNSRIDDGLALKHLTYKKYNSIVKPKVDAQLARQRLTEEELAKITKTYENRLTFGLAD